MRINFLTEIPKSSGGIPEFVAAIRIGGRTCLSQLGFQAKAERLSSDKLLQIWVPRINPSLIVQTELSQRDRLVLGPNSLLVQHVRQAPFPLQRLGFMYR